MIGVDLEARVASIVREAADVAILPRYQRLLDSEVEQKSPGELVTVADRDSEAFISQRLLDLLPGSSVVGEEAVATDAALLETLHAGYVWLVDPLDGTSNFVAGRPEFAVLIALLHNGRTIASWQFAPIAGSMCIAAEGAGAFVNGTRVTPASGPSMRTGRFRGAIFTRFLPDQLKARVAEASSWFGEILPGTKCAAFEYPRVATGEQDFVLYWRLMPWDHAAGVLFLEEAGGYVRHLDGTSYAPTERREGLLATRNAAAWQEIRDTLTSTGQ